MSKLYRAILPIVMIALILASCSPASTPAPTPTTAPAAPADTATSAPTQPAASTPTSAATATGAAGAGATATATGAAATATSAATATVAATATQAGGGAATATVLPSPTVTLAPVKEGTLTIWADANRVKALKKAVAAFTAKTNVPVNIQELGFGDIRDQLKIAGPAGEGADIIVGAHDWLGELVSNGLLEPIDLGAAAKNFDPVSLQAFSYNGKLYGVPYAVEAVALIYNKDLVPTPPATWEELEKVAKQLQDEKKVDQAYVLQQGDPYHTNPLLTAFGGYVFGTNPDKSYNPKDVGLDSAGGLASAKELDKMVKAGLLRKDVDYNLMASLFKDKKSAMMIGGPWMLPDIKAAKINYGIANVPAGPAGKGRPFVGVQGFMVSAFAKNKDLAKAFLTEYVASDEVMQSLYDVDPRSPAWMPVREKLTDPDLKAFAASAADGMPMPAIPEMSAVWDAWTKGIVLIFQQQQDPEQAYKDAAKTIRDKIAAGK